MEEPGKKDILLHVCCAPCSAGIIECLLDEGRTPTVFFYNPNIFPFKEYLLRKSAVISFVQKKGVPFVDTDYDNSLWMARVKGFEQEPERGRRCDKCFDLRLERSALFAHEQGYKILATTNAIARWKDMDQVHRAGFRAVARYEGLDFLDRNWRLDKGLQRMAQVTAKEGFYKQNYCGCLYSMR
jgi:predicted adenine nucleotide alpha hydrolase (AANH) superfamily ATPase